MKILLCLFLTTSLALTTATEKITIQTNSCCAMSQRLIERALLAVDGVKRADLDLVTSEVRVKYDPDRTEPAILRQAIAAAGFVADDVQPRPRQIAALPLCCREGKEGCKAPGSGEHEHRP